MAKSKDAIETQMILNHKAAIEMLIEDADEVGFDAFTFLRGLNSDRLTSSPQGRDLPMRIPSAREYAAAHAGRQEGSFLDQIEFELIHERLKLARQDYEVRYGHDE